MWQLLVLKKWSGDRNFFSQICFVFVNTCWPLRPIGSRHFGLDWTAWRQCFCLRRTDHEREAFELEELNFGVFLHTLLAIGIQWKSRRTSWILPRPNSEPKMDIPPSNCHQLTVGSCRLTYQVYCLPFVIVIPLQWWSPYHYIWKLRSISGCAHVGSTWYIWIKPIHFIEKK